MQNNKPYNMVLVKGEGACALLREKEVVPQDKWELFEFYTLAEKQAFALGLGTEAGDGWVRCFLVQHKDYGLLEGLDMTQFKNEDRTSVKFEIDVELTHPVDKKGWAQVQDHIVEAILNQIEHSEKGFTTEEGDALTEDVVVSCEHTGLSTWIRQKSNGRFFSEIL